MEAYFDKFSKFSAISYVFYLTQNSIFFDTKLCGAGKRFRHAHHPTDSLQIVLACLSRVKHTEEVRSKLYCID